MFLHRPYKSLKTIGLFCCFFSFVSCKQFTQSISETFEGRPEEIRKPGQSPLIKWFKSDRDYLGDTVYLQEAGKAFRKLPEFNNRKIVLYDKVYFYDDGRILIKVQDADSPRHINEYRYDNKSWSRPQPVRLRAAKIATIPEHLFPLDSLSFPAVSKVWKNYNRTAVEKQAEPATFVCFVFQHDRQGSWWLPGRIDGERALWEIVFNKEGDIVLFEKK